MCSTCTTTLLKWASHVLSNGSSCSGLSQCPLYPFEPDKGAPCTHLCALSQVRGARWTDLAMDDCEFFCVGNALELKETFFVYARIERVFFLRCKHA